MDKAQKIIADTMKLIGNSGYGSLILDKEKHQDILYAEGWGAAQLNINDPRLKKCALVTDNLYEMEMAKTKIRFDLPIQLGYHILQLAKLRMLQFRYDCLQEYCDVNDFEYIEMDTDSAYLSLSGKQLEDIVKPSKKQELHHEKMGQCHDFDYSSEDGFFPRECCQKHKAYDKRTPGLFKVEAQGKAMIALCSKTYMLKKHDDKVKFSSKGLNKAVLKEPFPSYQHVLQTGQTKSSTNQGFRTETTPFTPTNKPKEDSLTFTARGKSFQTAFIPDLYPLLSPLGLLERWKWWTTIIPGAWKKSMSCASKGRCMKRPWLMYASKSRMCLKESSSNYLTTLPRGK